MSKWTGYIGTYTKKNSKGIYQFTLDGSLGKIIDIKLAAELSNPTYLTISKDNQHLYAVVQDGEAGGVAAFQLNEQTGELIHLNQQVSLGAPPCYVSVGEEKEFVFSANYHKGTVLSYIVNEDGTLQPPCAEVKHHGSGPDPRQEKAHLHYAGLTPDGQFVVAIDLGSDALYTYELEGEQLKEKNTLSIRPGSGPRHLVFHPELARAYIMTEFSSEVVVLQYDRTEGDFSVLQTISTIPADFTENNQGSAIYISSDGRFIYAGNRGHNSIAVFRVESNGELSFVEHVSSEGNWPRDFALDPSGKFIVSSNQESDNLILFSRDVDSGKLTLLQSDLSVPEPVCIKFLNHYML